jgi:hypothetical protein
MRPIHSRAPVPVMPGMGPIKPGPYGADAILRAELADKPADVTKANADIRKAVIDKNGYFGALNKQNDIKNEITGYLKNSVIGDPVLGQAVKKNVSDDPALLGDATPEVAADTRKTLASVPPITPTGSIQLPQRRPVGPSDDRPAVSPDPNQFGPDLALRSRISRPLDESLPAKVPGGVEPLSEGIQQTMRYTGYAPGAARVNAASEQAGAAPGDGWSNNDIYSYLNHRAGVIAPEVGNVSEGGLYPPKSGQADDAPNAVHNRYAPHMGWPGAGQPPPGSPDIPVAAAPAEHYPLTGDESIGSVWEHIKDIPDAWARTLGFGSSPSTAAPLPLMSADPSRQAAIDASAAKPAPLSVDEMKRRSYGYGQDDAFNSDMSFMSGISKAAKFTPAFYAPGRRVSDMVEDRTLPSLFGGSSDDTLVGSAGNAHAPGPNVIPPAPAVTSPAQFNIPATHLSMASRIPTMPMGDPGMVQPATLPAAGDASSPYMYGSGKDDVLDSPVGGAVGNPYANGADGPMAGAPVGSTMHFGQNGKDGFFSKKNVGGAIGGVVGSGLGPVGGFIGRMIGQGIGGGAAGFGTPYVGPLQGGGYANGSHGGYGFYGSMGTSPWGSQVYSAPGTAYSNSPFTPSGYTPPSFDSKSGGPTFAFHPNGDGTGTYINSAGNVLGY